MTRFAHYLNTLQRFGIRPGLERIRTLLKLAGEPQNKYPVILVGGTNGKGSTCEFLARMLAEDGKRVGLYTSPHLYEWSERIRILDAGCLMPDAGLFPGAIYDEELDALFKDALPLIETVACGQTLGQPTEFEVLTLLGLLHFARVDVDVAVVEVGLGGRWDATNATEPVVSVITHVALDHCDRLGNTLEEIARDKVEIARPNRILVTAETKPEVLRVFEEHCMSLDCKLRIVDFAAGVDFQEINFQTALAAREELSKALGWPPISHSTLNTPHRSTPHRKVPARLETIQESPQVILDSANNPDGASTLARELQKILHEKSGARLILVLGILQDKDFAAMTRVLAPLAHCVFATQSNSPRAASAETIAEEARKFCARTEVRALVMEAVHRALEVANENDVICITGSFYTVAEVERDVITRRGAL